MFEAVKTRRERERDESKIARFPHSDSQLSLSTYTPSSLFSSPPFWLDSSAHTRRTDRASKWKVTRGRGVRVEGEFRRKGVCTRTSDTRHQTQKKKDETMGPAAPRLGSTPDKKQASKTRQKRPDRSPHTDTCSRTRFGKEESTDNLLGKWKGRRLVVAVCKGGERKSEPSSERFRRHVHDE